MFTLEELEKARAAGVPWTDLIQGHAPVATEQLHEAHAFVRFRTGFGPDQDLQTVRRAARILRCSPDAPLREKVLGLPPDLGHPEAADFSDLSAALDRGAEAIHRRLSDTSPNPRLGV
jgi:hypothetical protein